jgi:hypothetical protein
LNQFADINTFIDNAAWAIHSTDHMVLKASPGAAIFGQDMLFVIPFVTDWKQIGDYRQCQTDRSNARENRKHVGVYYKVGDNVPIKKNGILHKAVSIWNKQPWTTMAAYKNGTNIPGFNAESYWKESTSVE